MGTRKRGSGWQHFCCSALELKKWDHWLLVGQPTHTDSRMSIPSSVTTLEPNLQAWMHWQDMLNEWLRCKWMPGWSKGHWSSCQSTSALLTACFFHAWQGLRCGICPSNCTAGPIATESWHNSYHESVAGMNRSHLPTDPPQVQQQWGSRKVDIKQADGMIAAAWWSAKWSTVVKWVAEGRHRPVEWQILMRTATRTRYCHWKVVALGGSCHPMSQMNFQDVVTADEMTSSSLGSCWTQRSSRTWEPEKVLDRCFRRKIRGGIFATAAKNHHHRVPSQVHRSLNGSFSTR